MDDTTEPITGEIPILKAGRTDRTSRIAIIRDIFGLGVVFCALCVMGLVIVDKNANEDLLEDQITALKQQVQDFQAEERSIDDIEADKTECRRRYQDVVDQNENDQVNLLGDYIVILTRLDDPNRLDALGKKADEIEETTRLAREAEKAKVEYGNLGSPIPCPIGQTVP